MANYIYTNGNLYTVNELAHAAYRKYIKKVPIGNGKYRYYYSKRSGEYKDISGRHTLEYKTENTNNLFSGEHRLTTRTNLGGKEYSHIAVTKEVGTLERGFKSFKRQISIGKRKVTSLIKKLFG